MGKIFAKVLINIGLIPLLLASSTVEKDKFPEPLTKANFEEELSQGLHIVEFYSPYCSHCKTLAPTWKDTWETFHEEGEKLNIRFSQVDCIESGDLCSEQNIEYFPTIRLYGPGQMIKTYPSNGKRTKEAFINFARKEALDPSNIDPADWKSQSNLLTDFDMINLLGGKGEKPFLISFWPSMGMKSTDDATEFLNCEECLAFQRTWKLLSNSLLSSGIATGHFNCLDYETICRELGFSNLATQSASREINVPRVALIIPNKESNNLHLYKRPFTLNTDPYEDFATRMAYNSQVPEISLDELSQIMKKDLNFERNSKSSVFKQDIHVVFSYNTTTVVPEDFDILEHVFEQVIDIPHAYLHKTDKNLMDLMRNGYEELYQIINYNNSEPLKILDDNFFALNTITQFPTFFIFKDGDLIANVFPGYSTTEMRNIDLIMSWIHQYTKPLISELTLSNFEDMLSFERKLYSQLAILFVNTSDTNSILESQNGLRSLRLAAYDFEDVRIKSNFEKVLTTRRKKKENVKLLKGKGSKPANIVQAMRQEIEHDDGSRVLLTYIDINEESNFLRELNPSMENKEPHVGDVVLIDKIHSKLVEKNVNGEFLSTSSPYDIREMMLAVGIPRKSTLSTLFTIPLANDTKKYSSLLGMTGMFAVLFVLAGVVFSIFTYKLYRRRRIMWNYKTKRNTGGLLGKADKKEFQD
ncbi:hypothetical protein KAFR_0K01120 [Kazachstania africana CBS 2517]|uniref:Thioredoxin domain-containing protein n=1 Tax=Kazachstania africana (strain ATCC 22294 / BCRC 22015 / CBS 2517 / CECT 1963 / NBRC 1671 / NRRL Y-8276) TaxID=1071382 RepID=H2B1G7_KAZAF|nr:hypothetical protein KAFR_0K01120 [Kazachstania africana CBS 2517]CCF60467.1 hypothetical protein KAFR_0K01120 [Kazachstania africana CBS 2517]